MVSGVYWSVGSRAVNEDSVAFESVRTDRGECTLMVVCDGIGSLSHGEIVSGYVTECMVRWFYSTGISMAKARVGKIKRSLCRRMYDCHMELKQTADSEGIRWGSTVTCVYISGHRFVYAHLGDSAAYMIGSTHKPGLTPKVTRITQAHVNERGELVKCIGSMGYFAPDMGHGILRKGNGILIASDGFTNVFTIDELSGSLSIGGTLSNDRLDKRLAMIGAEVMRRGGTDNRSAVCVLM